MGNLKQILKPQDMTSLLNEYQSILEKEKILKKRKNDIATLVKDYAEREGVKNNTGSFYCEDDQYIYGKQCRKSVSIDNEKAKDLLETKGLWREAVDIVEVVNENKLENLVNEGKLSMQDIEDISVTKVTYAVDIKKKEQTEDMPEVQQVVASKKKVLKKRK